MTDSGRDDNVGGWLTEYQAPLVGFVLPMVNGDLQAAEDVVQETMLRGWQPAQGARHVPAGQVPGDGRKQGADIGTRLASIRLRARIPPAPRAGS